MEPKDTNFNLSQTELTVLSDTSFFELKRDLTERIISGFGILEREYRKEIEKNRVWFPEETLLSAKISRGENYRGLPYVILDFPRKFSREGTFAYRTLFWWGNPFSFTFHLSGKYLKKQPASAFHDLLVKEFSGSLVCINHNQWEHHFEKDNYIPVEDLQMLYPGFGKMISERGFLKITKLLPLNRFADLVSAGTGQLQKLIQLLK